MRESCFEMREGCEQLVGRSPHPGVDSLAPARSALRAFGSAEFLSLLPKQLKSPKEKENAFQCLGNGKRRVRRAR